MDQPEDDAPADARTSVPVVPISSTSESEAAGSPADTESKVSDADEEVLIPNLFMQNVHYA